MHATIGANAAKRELSYNRQVSIDTTVCHWTMVTNASKGVGISGEPDVHRRF